MACGGLIGNPAWPCMIEAYRGEGGTLLVAYRQDELGVWVVRSWQAY